VPQVTVTTRTADEGQALLGEIVKKSKGYRLFMKPPATTVAAVGGGAGNDAG
jgi:hypothetical protein